MSWPQNEDEVLAAEAARRWRTNLIVPPVLVGLAWLVTLTPFAFFLRGFQIWVHEFGHATVAWMTGRRALPLPFGWTNVEPEFSHFVYFGVLFLLTVLFVAGWRERKVWPMVFAVALAGLQYWMTWRWPEARQQFWFSFGGVAGEFVLNALAMMLFFVELPDRFRWGTCRYIVFFLAAASFILSFTFWQRVYHGQEPLPLGTMIGGEDDAGGDLNILIDDFGWSPVRIRQTYHILAVACAWAGVAAYLLAACRVGRAVEWVLNRCVAGGRDSEA
jgi:MFS superfamily sulfate permease-like transporter